MDCKEYARNLEEYSRLDQNTDVANLSEGEFIEKLIANSLGKREILIENNAFLKENLEPYERDYRLVTKQIEGELEKWVDSLNDPSTGAWSDRGTAERVQRVLYNVYMANKEYDKAAKAIFHLTYFDIIHREHFAVFSSSTHEEASMKWAELFDELSEEGKIYAIRYFFALCFDISNMKNAYNRFLFAKSFYDRLDDKLKNHSSVKRSMMSGLFDTINLTGEVLGSHTEKYTDEEMDTIRQIYELHESLEDIDNFFPTCFADNNRFRMNYHLGIISLDEFLELNRKRVFCERRENETELYLDFFIGGAYYIQYLWEYSDYPTEEKYEKSYEIIDTVLNFCNTIKKADENINSVTNVAIFVNTAAKYLGYSMFKNQVIDITVRADKALYIHTTMVYLISVEIVKDIIKTTPEYFDWVGGLTTDEIQKDPNKILALVKECAFLHDIGKHCCIDYVSNASRNLTDREFEAIKMHPENFEEFFGKDEKTDAAYNCVRDCALLHHVWHNGEGGYPKRKHTANRPMVDIISIADSIDAATDIIGRPYASRKTLNDLIDEFDTFRDTRYSAFVIDRLKKPELNESIASIITEGRRHINFDVYTGKTEGQCFNNL